MSSTKKHKKKKRRSKVAPDTDSLLTRMEMDDVRYSDNKFTVTNNLDRSKSSKHGVKTSTADTVKVFQNVQKGVNRFKEMRRTRRKCVTGSPSKGIKGLDGTISEDPMKPNPHNRHLISYFSKLADFPDTQEEIDLEYVDMMLNAGASIHCIDRYGQTIFHEVAREWEIDVAKFLLERGADINRADCFGRTPLHVAAAVDYAEMVKFLVENGANIECKTREELQTPLHYAACNDACESLKMLHKLGADIHQRDYKDRSPLQVAAELDRSETALILLDLGANASDMDRSGLTAMVLMICKMPSVAIEALNKFHRQDRANRKQYYDIHLLEQTKPKDREPRSRSVLQVVVEYNQLELIKHPVMLRLIDIKWMICGRYGVLKQVIWNIFIILLWTILAVTMKSPITYDFSQAEDIVQFSVFMLATVFTFVQIFLEIREYLGSKTNFKKWKEWRIGEVKKDLKFCHPRWPQEKAYLEQEIKFIESKGPSYFSEFWNYLDWFVYILLLTVSVCHITAWLTKSCGLSDVTIRIFAVTIIFVWCRFMKVARAFRVIGPFIVMLGHITKDCARFLFLYLEFYIPYLCAFWMIFGGCDKATTVNGMATFDDLAFSLFRITLVDDYDYDSMKEIDKIMAHILLGSFLAISALVGINLFIALLSDTFQRVYDNAFSNAIMQQASIMQGIEEGLSRSKKEKVREYIHQNCAPQTLFYDDDNVAEDGDELKKVTFQIKDDLDILREQYHGLDIECKEMVGVIKSEIRKVKDKQSIAVSEITSELHLLKQLVQQLIDRPVQPDGSYNHLSRGQGLSPTPDQLQPQRVMQVPLNTTADVQDRLYIQPRFVKATHSILPGGQTQFKQANIKIEDDFLSNQSVGQSSSLNMPVIPDTVGQNKYSPESSSKERLNLYRKQRKKTMKKRQEQEDYLEQKQKNQTDGVLKIEKPTGQSLSPFPRSLSYISDDNDQPLLKQFKFRSSVTSSVPSNSANAEEPKTLNNLEEQSENNATTSIENQDNGRAQTITDTVQPSPGGTDQSHSGNSPSVTSVTSVTSTDSDNDTNSESEQHSNEIHHKDHSVVEVGTDVPDTDNFPKY